jgi:transposase-like protein
MNLQSMRTQLTRLERQKLALERRIRDRHEKQEERFTSLPSRLGLKTVDSLIYALAHYASPMLRARIQQLGRNGAPSTNGDGVAPLTAPPTVRFSQEAKNDVRAALIEGKESVVALSRKHGPSIATIHAWKRGWNLTRARPLKKPGVIQDSRAKGRSSDAGSGPMVAQAKI